jgi:hypothetical protein
MTSNTERLILVQLRISSWSGQKGLQKSELPQAIVNGLPPDDLARLGQKRLVDPKMLNPFDKIRRRAHRNCEMIGVNRGAACYLVPEMSIKDLEQFLIDCQHEFNKEATEFVSQFDAHVEQWLSGFGEWKDALMRQVPDSNTVHGRFSFDWMIFDVMPSAESSKSAKESFDKELESARSKLFDEVSEAARTVVDTFFIGRDYVTQRVIKDHLMPLADKLSGMSLLTQLALPLSRQIQDVIEGLPKTGRIHGNGYSELQALIMMLSDSDRAEKHAKALLNGEAPSLFDLTALPENQAGSSMAGIDWDAIEDSIEIPDQPGTPDSASTNQDSNQPPSGGFILSY